VAYHNENNREDGVKPDWWSPKDKVKDFDFIPQATMINFSSSLNNSLFPNTNISWSSMIY
jgi:hypothetical protein